MYTVIGTRKNRTVRVLWMLEELGLPYDLVDAQPRTDGVTKHYEPGKVPVLLAEDHVIPDSVAIMTYLADKHGMLTFAAGTVDRAIQDSHTMFVMEEFDSTLWHAAKNSFIWPEEHRVPAVKDSLKWEFETSLRRLEDRLGDGPYLMGDTLTVPDLLAAHCSGWAKNAGFPQPSDKLARYFGDLRSREAFLRATAT